MAFSLSTLKMFLFAGLFYFQKQLLRQIVKNSYLNVRIFREIYMAQYLSVYSENLKFTKRYSSKYLTRRQVQDKFIKIKISPDFIIKASIETIIVTVSPVLKIFFSIEIEIRFWKTPFRIISQNLASFQGKYLWRISNLAKALSLGLTVILLVILKLMILRNFKKTHSEASRISKMEHCGKMVNRLYLRCLTGF